jgi:hypothetical protein
LQRQYLFDARLLTRGSTLYTPKNKDLRVYAYVSSTAAFAWCFFFLLEPIYIPTTSVLLKVSRARPYYLFTCARHMQIAPSRGVSGTLGWERFICLWDGVRRFSRNCLSKSVQIYSQVKLSYFAQNCLRSAMKIMKITELAGNNN